MNGTSKKGMTLFVTLGFILSVLAVFAPVGATAGRAGNFTVNSVTFANATGAPITEADLGQVVSVIGNASIAAAGVNVTLFKMMLTINDVAITPDTTEAPLDIGAFAENTWSWTPVSYGDYTVNVTAINGTDTANQTVATTSFTIKAMDFNIHVVTVSPETAYVNITQTTITAEVHNHGNKAGMANVTFKLDNSQLLGNTEINVPALTLVCATLQTNFAGMVISDGNHTVTASVSVPHDSSNVSNNVTIINPVADIQITGVDASPNPITIQKGASLNVTITAHLKNFGMINAQNFDVKFYVDDSATAKDIVNVADIVAPDGTLDVSDNWTVTDAVTLGNHSIMVGVLPESSDPYWVVVNVTVNGLAQVAISNFTANPAAAFEGDNITLTVKLFNNGTADALNLTVEFFDGTVGIGTRTNISVSKGQEITVPALIANVGVLTADTNKTYKAKVGAIEATAVVTAKDRVAKIEITAFTVETGRIGDNVTMTATVKNNGTGDAIGLVVDFYDGTTKVGSAAAINLTVQSTKDVSISYKLAGAADANHTFFAKGLGAEKNVTKSVGHTLAPAAIQIVSFTVKPTKKEGQPKDSTQEYKVTITLKNTGEVMGIAILNLTEKGKLITPISVPVIIDANGNTTQTYTWKVKGEGDHTCVATLTGNVGTPSTMSVKATLKYTPGFEVLALIGAIVAALILVRRRKN